MLGNGSIKSLQIWLNIEQPNPTQEAALPAQDSLLYFLFKKLINLNGFNFRGIILNMKTAFKIFLLILVIAMILLLAMRYKSANAPTVVPNNQTAPQNIDTSNQNLPDISNQSTATISGFQSPLDRSKERITKKPFGIYIAPATSPVQPEKFQGYHTGTDWEIFPEEQSSAVPVKAICSGKLILKKSASGYGGVAVESCKLDNKPITVIYGHLKLGSINAKINANLNIGDEIGILGAAYSAETDGERKHLHLGMHRGSAINILGYVSSESQLSDWIDACQYICSN